MNRVMKFAALLSCAIPVCISCDTEFSTRTIEISEKFALTDGRADSLDLSIKAEFPETGKGKENTLKISSAITEALFGEEYMSMAPEAAVEAYKTDLAEEYRTENLPMLEIEGLEDSSLGWTDYTEGRFVSVMKDMVSYVAVKYSYCGGAHGMTSETAFVFDRKTGNRIPEDRFFREGYVPELARLLTGHLPEALESPADTSMLFLKEIGPNGNFSIDDDGVTYIFNQYEIAPYSMGIIRISIPWEELEGLY